MAPFRPTSAIARSRGFSRPQNWESLRPLLLAADQDVEAGLEKLRRYAELLLLWNRHVSNLISENDERRIVDRHLVESIQPAGWLKASGAQQWVDFGSGAGLPAIPLALIGVGIRWSLIESRRPKVLFMRRVIQDLKVRNIEVIHSRIETVALDPERPLYQAFTSRATLPLKPTLHFAHKILEPHGTAFLWKGSRVEEEMRDEAWGPGWVYEGGLTVGNEHTTVARFKKA